MAVGGNRVSGEPQSYIKRLLRHILIRKICMVITCQAAITPVKDIDPDRSDQVLIVPFVAFHAFIRTLFRTGGKGQTDRHTAVIARIPHMLLLYAGRQERNNAGKAYIFKSVHTHIRLFETNIRIDILHPPLGNGDCHIRIPLPEFYPHGKLGLLLGYVHLWVPL